MIIRHEMLTEREHRYCTEIRTRIAQARAFLLSDDLADPPEPKVLFQFLAKLREIQGNVSNDVSFTATLMAKEYLSAKFGVTFDAAEKPQGAPGIDIDVLTGLVSASSQKSRQPFRIKLQTSAQQAASFKKDFVKLTNATAMHKFLFVTDRCAYVALQKPKYLAQIHGVRVVNLITEEEISATPSSTDGVAVARRRAPMGKRVLTGFDSAWTRGNRGAVVSLITEDGQRRLVGPDTASFDEAVEHVRAVTEGADLHALAIDQPLIVNNDARRRPVEDVVAHVMGRFGSAVQPANRSKDSMFGTSAPIWSCLNALRDMGFIHSPHSGDRMKASGRFFFEVYPALGNLGLFPVFYRRGTVPRYNPERGTFNLGDWRLLIDAVTDFLGQHGADCTWLGTAKGLMAPRSGCKISWIP